MNLLQLAGLALIALAVFLAGWWLCKVTPSAAERYLKRQCSAAEQSAPGLEEKLEPKPQMWVCKACGSPTCQFFVAINLPANTPAPPGYKRLEMAAESQVGPPTTATPTRVGPLDATAPASTTPPTQPSSPLDPLDMESGPVAPAS
jgi:hypothetical protein